MPMPSCLFPSRPQLVEEVLPIKVTKYMEIHIAKTYKCSNCFYFIQFMDIKREH
jgi:hypothetical protein